MLPERPWEHERWPLCVRLVEHALSAAGHAERHETTRELTAVVLARVGQYQHARAQYAAARDLTVRALAIKEAVYGLEHPEVTSTLGNLGIVQRQLGELRPRARARSALAILEVVYGSEHPEVAITLGNLGIVQQRARPAVRSPVDLGYARVSTVKQDLDRQIDALTATGIPLKRIYLDRKSGATVDRPRAPRAHRLRPRW